MPLSAAVPSPHVRLRQAARVKGKTGADPGQPLASTFESHSGAGGEGSDPDWSSGAREALRQHAAAGDVERDAGEAGLGVALELGVVVKLTEAVRRVMVWGLLKAV